MADQTNNPEELEIDALSKLISNLDTTRGHATPESQPKTASAFVRLNPEVFVGAKVNDSAIAEMKEFGIKSVFTLDSPNQEGLAAINQKLEAAGMQTVSYPVEQDSSKWTDELLDTLLAKLDTCEKPALVFCEHGVRSAMIGMAHNATRSRFNEGKLRGDDDPDAFFTRNAEVFARWNRADESSVSMKEYLKSYIAGKVKNMITRPGLAQLQEELFVSGQLTEEEIEKLKDQGIKSVINMRPYSESGQFGAGVLPREEELITKQGIDYVHVPVPRNGPYDDPDILSIVTAHLDNLQRPILVHCRTGGRAKAVLKNANYIE